MKINKIIYILIFAFSSMSVNAQLYKAKGLGGTVDEAKKEAVTNAIKFSVGEFIANKEVMDDDNFNQKVVSYSNAYVKRISLISEEKLSDNEYEVEVEVDIEKYIKLQYDYLKKTKKINLATSTVKFTKGNDNKWQVVK